MKYYVIHLSEYGRAVVAGPLSYEQAAAWIHSQPAEYAQNCIISQ